MNALLIVKKEHYSFRVQLQLNMGFLQSCSAKQLPLFNDIIPLIFLFLYYTISPFRIVYFDYNKGTAKNQSFVLFLKKNKRFIRLGTFKADKN